MNELFSCTVRESVKRFQHRSKSKYDGLDSGALVKV